MLIILLSLFSINLYASSAESPLSIDEIYLGIGQFYDKAYQNEATDIEIFEINPIISLFTRLKMMEHFALNPEFSWVLPRNSQNTSAKLNQFNFKLDMEYNLYEPISLYLGTSLSLIMLSGNGEEKELPSGTGTTEFYAPNDTRTSYNQTLDFGIGYKWDRYLLKINLNTYKILDAPKSVHSLSFIFHYQFHLGDKT